MTQKLTLNAAYRLTAMPKPKKKAEQKIVDLSETLFAHVLKLRLFGNVQDTNKWLKEVRSRCFEIHGFASDTTNGHLDPEWVFTQIFTDFAKSEQYCSDAAVIMADNNPEYQPRLDPEKDAHELYTSLHDVFVWLSLSLVDKNYRIAGSEFYDQLKRKLHVE